MKKMVNIVLCAFLCALVFASAFALSSCQGGAAQTGPISGYADLSTYPEADMSGYDCAEGYNKQYRFATMTVAEVTAEMDAGSTFVVYTGYNHCPWCNVVLNHLNDIATERDITIAYIDTRANPAWQSNLDMDDYDLFVDYFGDALSTDDNGIKHLYVPHIFFVKEGKLVYDHPGTVPSQESPSDELSQEQIDELRGIMYEGLNAIS